MVAVAVAAAMVVSVVTAVTAVAVEIGGDVVADALVMARMQ